MKIDIARADPGAPVFQAFLHASDDYAASLYPAESNHMLDVASLLRPDTHFFGIFTDGAARGCGGFRMHDGYVEIKRVWIEPSARGLGLSQRLMTLLEHEARALGFSLARLETGISQPEALGLYRRRGYVECRPFGDYKPDPLSIFMEKTLAT